MSWQVTEILSENFSSKSNIKIMHQELKNKSRMAKELPTLCLVWNSENNKIIEKVYNLTEV